MRMLLVSLVILLGSLFLPPQVQAVAFTRDVFVQNVTANSTELRWKTDTGASVTVNYGTTPSYGQSVQSDSVSGETNNHARVTGLTVNTKYYYQLVSGGTALTPAGDSTYYFKTAPATGSTTPFTFAIWGDSGEGSGPQIAVANQVNSRTPDSVLIAGDVIYDYSANPEFNDGKHFDIYKSISRHSPFYPTCGNHDRSNCGVLVNDHSLPQGGRAGGLESVFSWDWGNVHFTALNSNSITTAQRSWFVNDLRSSNQPWKVVMWHHNGWSAGSHSTLTNIMSTFVADANANGADVVIWGHSHVFEAWKRDPTNPNIRMFTIGNGGNTGASSCTATSPGPGCEARSTSGGESGFLLGEVNGNQMTMRYITNTGANPYTTTLDSGGPGPTSTPGPSPTPSRSPTPTRTLTPTRTPTPGGPSPTRTPTPGPCSSTLANQGDANCDCTVSGVDYAIWLAHYRQSTGNGFRDGDFNGDGTVTGVDYAIWLAHYRQTCSGPTPTPTPGGPTATRTPTPSRTPTPGGPSPTPPTGGQLDQTVCYPNNGPFSLTINNEWLPFPVGMVHVLEGGGLKVQVSVLNQTEVVAGVTTWVVEEREWQNNNLIEVSRNFFVQAPNGTVCYYGEDVADGSGNPIGGSWRVGVNGARAGIMMPPTPVVGMRWLIEDAQASGAYEDAVVMSTGQSYTTPAGTFQNVVYIEEDNHRSRKRYAPGVGMIFDDGIRLTQR